MSNTYHKSAMRSLTLEEINQLEMNRCHAEDWGNIVVAEDFDATYVQDVNFYGEVTLGLFEKSIELTDGLAAHSGIRHATLCNVSVGDNCLIENIGGYISNYDIADGCYIANVGSMETTAGATFAQGNLIAVGNEAGNGNVVMYSGLSSQMAALMVYAEQTDASLCKQLLQLAKKQAQACIPTRGQVGYGAKIIHTQEVVNTLIGDDCEVCGASLLCDSTLTGITEAGSYMGHGTICKNSIIAAGSVVTDGARIDNCYVGEACHIGKGFSAENSVFFANAHLDNGEACAAFCGPFTVSHHKATLLIGVTLSFYNAGSATNFSNHAYKIGPVHYGTLERGCKTASGAHLLLPATIGAFSVCIGKIANHPCTATLPFSYVIGNGDTTYIVPGRNLLTVGTWRDINKWSKRDKRPRTERKSIVNFDWLNPMVIQALVHGKRELQALQQEQGAGAAAYTYGNCVIKRSALLNGLRYYDLAIRLYVGDAVKKHHDQLPQSSMGTGAWTDMGGLLLPMTEVEQLTDDIRQGAITNTDDLEQQFMEIHHNYDSYKWNSAYCMVLNHLGVDSLTPTDLQQIAADYRLAQQEWLCAVKRDAEKEHQLGDMNQELLQHFLTELDQYANSCITPPSPTAPHGAAPSGEQEGM